MLQGAVPRVREGLLPAAPLVAAVLLLARCVSSPAPTPSGSPTTTPTVSPAGPSASGTAVTPSTSPPSTATASGSLPTTGPSPTLSGFGTAPVTGGTPWPGPRQARLVRVTVGTHAGYDRLVLELAQGPVPTYEVTTQDSAEFTREGSDAEAELLGDAGVLVVLRGTTVGPTARAWLLPRYPAIREVDRLGEFEAVVSYGVGVAGVAQVRVTTLSSPARLVVDVLQP